ncbi:DoxX family protein [Tsuneonella mangrovi]|uniref:DoxX family protein n=1 Tax=Tsuneonella mangrovi TaxID=1982042 RepID=UPI000BA21D7E|nr:DoxX family protein [Tsuneonella mangrovi]
MRTLVRHWNRATAIAGSRWPEAATLLLVRLALAGVFWRSGRTKVVEGTWLHLSDATRYLFATEYSGVPLPSDLAAHLSLLGETFLPILLVLGLATRLSALGLLGMTMVIQVFVYPDAWWPVHSLWAALALVLVVRGSGAFALDPLLARGLAR